MTLAEFLDHYIEFVWTVCAGIIVGVYTLVSQYSNRERDRVNTRLETLSDELSELRSLVHETRETFVTVNDLDNAVDLIISSNEKTEKKFEYLIEQMQQNKADKSHCSLVHELASVRQGRRTSDRPIDLENNFD